MSSNFESAYFPCQLSHPFSKASGAGNIVFTSCVTGVTYYMTGGSLYSATKAGLNQLTKNLASSELAYCEVCLRSNSTKTHRRSRGGVVSGGIFMHARSLLSHWAD
ncbi:hypothetical protein SLEP1_g41513 [Rubroshorea leprosula]|uniref:Uncharacterized protein n=1 Tax=Rubroshorea leprosula TaxID=152421 RepID=A0AAV5L7R0_9ROSI|nr:hypothetical protein SLEP1_g41513 [Rubroshorea leprosula]